MKVKGKLVLVHTMKAYGKVEVSQRSFLTTVAGEGKWSVSSPDSFSKE
jgi:hypothetical protein